MYQDKETFSSLSEHSFMLHYQRALKISLTIRVKESSKGGRLHLLNIVQAVVCPSSSSVVDCSGFGGFYFVRQPPLTAMVGVL